MKINCCVFISLLFIAGCVSLPPNAQIIYYYQAETQKTYDDVLTELEIAISEYNFRITGHSRVGKVIRDRGTENFPEYDTFQFCNLTLAKTLLELDPHAISYMPCNIVTYQFKQKTIVKSHLLPTNTDNEKLNLFSKRMNIMIKAIVDFAVEE